MFFDARTAKLLKPTEHLLVDGFLGLRLVATATKKTWIYRFKKPGTTLMKQQKIGSWPEMPVDKAKDEWQKLLSKRSAGEDIIANKKIEAIVAKFNSAEKYTLEHMVTDYAKGYLEKMRQARGAKAIKARLLAAIEKYKKLPIENVDRRFVFDLIESLSAAPTIAKTVKTEMRAAFEYALNAGRINENLPNWWALSKIKTLKSKGAMRDGKRKGTGKRVLTNVEIKTLMQKDMPILVQDLSDFLTLQLWTCTRGNEIVNMQAKQITDEADGVWWTVPHELTKNRNDEDATDLRVPLVGKALEIVNRRRINGNEWMFQKSDRKGVLGPQEQGYMSSQVFYHQPYSKTRPKHIRTRLSVTHWSPHDLRRTGRTLLASMKCPDEIGEEIIGHKKPGVVGVYNLYKYDKERRYWLTKLNAKLKAFIAA